MTMYSYSTVLKHYEDNLVGTCALTCMMRLYCGVVSLSSALVVERVPPDLISNEPSSVEGSME